MRLFFALSCALLAWAAAAQTPPMPPAPPAIAANAWLLVDPSSNQTLAGVNADSRVEPASLTKLMTAYVVFSALKEGALKLDQRVAVSERAWQAPGSRMFIAPDLPVSVDELIRGMIVQSGNDACIALAEAVAGTEAAFVERMNHEAARMGLAHTHFANATGLPDPQHYATAADLARLAGNLIRDFPQDYRYYSIKEFRYNKITQPNRNRLLWSDPSVDGLKTGHTENAGYCLIASAQRPPRRLLAVVLGTASDTLRMQEAQKLLNFGFTAYDAVKLYDKEVALGNPKVFKGTANSVRAGFDHDLTLSLPHGATPKFQARLVSTQPLLAPIQKGQRIGVLQLLTEGSDKPWGEYPLVALDDVPLAGALGRAWDGLLLWFKKI